MSGNVSPFLFKTVAVIQSQQILKHNSESVLSTKFHISITRCSDYIANIGYMRHWKYHGVRLALPSYWLAP